MQLSCSYIVLFLLLSAVALPAAEAPYYVTYSAQMEEPGNLEISLDQVAGNAFLSSIMELEYGVRTWWTAEFYLDGQATRGQGALFTGWRIEHRFRPWMGEHRINPVLYVEFEDLNGAEKSFKEVVGHDVADDQLVPNAEARREHKREVETKLILSSNARGWDISANLTGEKNLAAEPWEFGYAFGASRPLALAVTPGPCTFCRENFSVGAEVFGGLGTWRQFGLTGTSHYIAPVVAWQFPSGPRLMVSPAFGLNGNSHGLLVRFALSYEIERIGRRFRPRPLLPAGDPYEGKPDAARAGAKLYARHCAQCHGPAAEGCRRAPSLRSVKVQTAPLEEIFHTVTNGVMRRGMPSWAHLPAERRWQIITYLRSLR